VVSDRLKREARRSYEQKQLGLIISALLIAAPSHRRKMKWHLSREFGTPAP